MDMDLQTAQTPQIPINAHRLIPTSLCKLL
jgi:hypothetical protein